MKQVICLNYDPSTGNVEDGNGVYIGCQLNIKSVKSAGPAIDDIVKLKDAGFTAEEIIELKRKEVIG